MMQQSDKELLELAAKAAGYAIDEKYNSSFYNKNDIVYNTLVILNEMGGHTLWNPLADDGDALRLAVKLGIDLHLSNNKIIYYVRDSLGHLIKIATIGYKNCDYRRAIVLAAAEIGRNMK